jgi:hypothetical protein
MCHAPRPHPSSCNQPTILNTWLHVRFQVLTAASMKMSVFWDDALRSLVETEQRFRGAYCLHHPWWWVIHRPDDGGSKLLWNVGQYLPEYTAQHPTRKTSSMFVSMNITCEGKPVRQCKVSAGLFIATLNTPCEIWGSHGGEDDDVLLGYDAV